MQITIATMHVRESAQAVALAAGCLKADLPTPLRNDTTLLDLFPDQSEDTMLDLLLGGKPAVIAFPLYTWNRIQVLDLCRRIRAKSPQTFLVAGGPEASADAASVLEEGGLDAVISGEGDHAFASLLEQLQSKSPLTGIRGLVTGTNKADRIEQAVCPDLNELISPWLTGTLPLEAGCGVLWEVARGCHFNCAFCYDAKGHQGVRPLPLERLKKELELFVERGVSQVWVLDSTFNAPAGRGKALLELLLTTAPQLHYHIEAKADLLDDDTIALLAELHCSVQVGLQSADPAILKRLNRKLNPRHLQQQLNKLSAAGVTFGVDLIYGLPDDTHQGFVKSLDFALKLQPNQIDIFPLAVLPGTELHEDRQRFGISGESKPPYLIEHNVSYSPEDMEHSRLLAAATDIFYNRGRAVGFFLQLCQAAKATPTALLDDFASWLQSDGIDKKKILNADSWSPEEILTRQLALAEAILKQAKGAKLIAAAQDLIHYHFCCAETLLAENCLPRKAEPFKKILNRTWQLNPAVKIKPFNYPVDELESYGGESLKVIAAQLDKDPCHAVFLRQDDELIIEPVDQGFATLLLKAQKQTSGAKLITHLDRNSGQELLGFSVAQGLLIRA